MMGMTVHLPKRVADLEDRLAEANKKNKELTAQVRAPRLATSRAVAAPPRGRSAAGAAGLDGRLLINPSRELRVFALRSGAERSFRLLAAVGPPGPRADPTAALRPRAGGRLSGSGGG